MLPTHVWKVDEILLEARYFNAPETKTISAFYHLSIARIPPPFRRDRHPVAGNPSLLIKGVDRKQWGSIQWDHLRFTDAVTGEEKEFTIQFVDTPKSDMATFAIIRER
jgi:hypothetical protein